METPVRSFAFRDADAMFYATARAKLNKAFIATGKILSRPQHNFACRTQVELALPADAIDKLKQSPLGNHHLVIPGNHMELLEMACRFKNIQMV